MEKRKNNNEIAVCPIHGATYRCREGEVLYCMIHECNWTAPARRKEDKEIPTLPDVKKDYHGL